MSKLNKIKIFNYNILTPNYCYPDKFPLNKPSDLNNNLRYLNIKRKLEDQIKNKSIICLQEVCRKWSNKLELLFNNNDYVYIKSLYGYKGNGYMGIAIAFPRSYNFLDCKIERLSDRLKIYKKKEKDICSKVKDTLFMEDDKESCFVHAKRRLNTVIALKLKEKTGDDKTPFWVFNYHMPCVFRVPEVMILHINLFKNYVERLTRSGGENCVIAGDFNSRPDTDQYKIMTRGYFKDLDKYFEDYPEFNINESEFSFRSVYKEYYEEEPICTNYSHCEQNGDFKDTIDYFFITKNVKITNVEKLNDTDKFMPNDEQPSDHFPLYCELEI